MKHCKKCSVEYLDDYAFCSHCGEKLDAGKIPNFCSKCGYILDNEDDLFCPSCGNKVVQSISQQGNKKGLMGNKNNMIIGAIAVVLLVLLGGFFYFKQDLINLGYIQPSTEEEYFMAGRFSGIPPYEREIRKAVMDADKGNLKAHYTLSKWEFKQENYAKAFKLAKVAASKGNRDAVSWLANFYYHGNGVERDLEKAFELHSTAYSDGNISSTYWIGVMYANGEGCQQDVPKAISILKRIAESSELDYKVEAQAKLGEIYYEPKYNNKNIKEAVYWLKKAYPDKMVSKIIDRQKLNSDEQDILDKADGVVKKSSKQAAKKHSYATKSSNKKLKEESINYDEYKSYRIGKIYAGMLVKDSRDLVPILGEIVKVISEEDGLPTEKVKYKYGDVEISKKTRRLRAFDTLYRFDAKNDLLRTDKGITVALYSIHDIVAFYGQPSVKSPGIYVYYGKNKLDLNRFYFTHNKKGYLNGMGFSCGKIK